MRTTTFLLRMLRHFPGSRAFKFCFAGCAIWAWALACHAGSYTIYNGTACGTTVTIGSDDHLCDGNASTSVYCASGASVTLPSPNDRYWDVITTSTFGLGVYGGIDGCDDYPDGWYKGSGGYGYIKGSACSIDSSLATNLDDLSDGLVEAQPTTGCDKGMPVWQVSEPFVSLWLKDEPLGYQPGIGSRISFELDFDQRDTNAGLNPSIFGTGVKWNCSWLSYVGQDIYGDSVVYFPGGGQRTYVTTNDYLTETVLTGNTTTGFTNMYPDGSEDVYGFVVTNSSGTFSNAFLTAHINPQAQQTQFSYYGYDPANPVVRLQYVIDGDGRTNSIYYATSNPYSTNLISEVVDPFGRSNMLSYDNFGHLTNIIDVGGISNVMTYDTSNWVASLITPYGTTTFAISNFLITNASEVSFCRSVRATEPDGGTELYLYEDNAPGVANSYSSGEVPVTTPFANTFENDDLALRNTFHWGRLQYAALSTTNISSFTSSDFLKARMKHWLVSVTGLISQTVSLERSPSPDSGGTIEGQKKWYDYANKFNPDFEGPQFMPLLVARVLPDGTTSFIRTDRNAIGNVLTNVSTWTSGGSVALRTNIFTYDATAGIDLITATNALGIQISSNAYNSYHEPLTHYDALNQATSFQYNTNQQVVSITLPTGLVISNIYGTNNFVSQHMTVGFATNSYTYANDLVATSTSALGLSVDNTWDNLQRLTQVAFPDSTSISYSYNILDLVQIVDRLGNTTSFGFNNIRELVGATNALGHSTAYGYCECGALDSIQNALGNTTTFNYDNESRRTNILFPDSSSVALSYNLLGQLTNSTEGAGISTNFYYNNQGLPIAVSNASGLVSAIVYDILDRPTNIINANGVSLSMTYDNLGRLLTRTYPDGGVERFGYSAAGLIAYTNQLTNVTYYSYDAEGRRITETNANNQGIQYAYDAVGDLVSLTDQNGHTTQWDYDMYGRVTNKVDAASTTILKYSYNADGELTNRWMMGTNTAYTYDAVGNLLSVTYPVSPGLSYSYDAINELTGMTDAVGTTSYSYTPIGQLQSVSGPFTNDTITYAYSDQMRTILDLQQPNAADWVQNYSYDTANRLQGTSGPAGTFSYAYNPGVGGVATSSALVAKIALPNSAWITNTYDSNGRMTGTYLYNSSATGLDSSVYTYNVGNQRTSLQRGQSTVNYSYDAIGQVVSNIAYEPISPFSPRLNEQLRYGYDPAGNLLSRTNNALVQSFAVNLLNELTTNANTGTLTVMGGTIAAVTNVTVNGTNALLYDDGTFAATNMPLTNSYTAVAQDSYGRIATNSITVSLSPTNTFLYDANGNLTNDGLRNFVYDDENQLIQVFVSNQWKSAFTYDGKMRRRIRQEYTWGTTNWVQTNAVYYIYDGNLVIQERDTNDLPTVTYTRGNDLSASLEGAGGIGGLLARTDTNGVIFYHSDGNGNVTMLINQDQITVAQYLYDAFGNVLSKSGMLADANRYQFSSKEKDLNSGLVYYLIRYYDANFQRWINRDPIGELGGVNLFTFADNNPINVIDFFGYEGFWASIYNSIDNFVDRFYGGGNVPTTTEVVEAAVDNVVSGGGIVRPFETDADGQAAAWADVYSLSGFVAFGADAFDVDSMDLNAATSCSSQSLAPAAEGTATPLGFSSADQFSQAVQELNAALAKSGITDASIGVRGSSVTGVSFSTGQPFSAASDIDFFIESGQLTQGLETSRNIPGFVYPSLINETYDPIAEWSQIWSENLGRDVSVGGFQPGTVPPGPVIRP